MIGAKRSILFYFNYFRCIFYSFTALSQNLEAWEEAKREIEKIPSHPNQPPAPPEKSQDKVPTLSARRDSAATVNGR